MGLSFYSSQGIVERDTSSSNDLARCIETDLAATSAILKVSNTIFYAKRQGKIQKVLDAVVRLGFKETKGLLAGLALIELAPGDNQSYGFSRQDFWMHSLAVAMLAENIFERSLLQKKSATQSVNQSLVFIAGLLHDIGKIPLDNKFPNIFTKILEESSTQLVPYLEAENNLIGLNHLSLGHYLLNKWMFPPVVPAIILNHHNPTAILKVSQLEEKLMHASVYSANVISKAMDLGHSCDNFLADIPMMLMKVLKLNKMILGNIIKKVEKDLNVICSYLKVLNKDDNLVYSGVSMTQPDDYDIMVFLGDKVELHPLLLSLEKSKFKIQTQILSGEEEKKAKVKIYIPNEDEALDITFYEKDGEQEQDSDLKIFLLQNEVNYHHVNEDSTKSNTVILNRDKVEKKIVMHYIDYFMEKGNLPEEATLSTK
jgi:putative nucleotidyltransferase with HDIG domain